MVGSVPAFAIAWQCDLCFSCLHLIGCGGFPESLSCAFRHYFKNNVNVLLLVVGLNAGQVVALLVLIFIL